jgi:hypothetical protein
MSRADELDRETDLLLKAGYFDKHGNPRQDAEGKRIWDAVQRQLLAEDIPEDNAKPR